MSPHPAYPGLAVLAAVVVMSASACAPAVYPVEITGAAPGSPVLQGLEAEPAGVWALAAPEIADAAAVEALQQALAERDWRRDQDQADAYRLDLTYAVRPQAVGVHTRAQRPEQDADWLSAPRARRWWRTPRRIHRLGVTLTDPQGREVWRASASQLRREAEGQAQTALVAALMADTPAAASD